MNYLSNTLLTTNLSLSPGDKGSERNKIVQIIGGSGARHKVEYRNEEEVKED